MLMHVSYTHAHIPMCVSYVPEQLIMGHKQASPEPSVTSSVLWLLRGGLSYREPHRERPMAGTGLCAASEHQDVNYHL